MPFSKLFSEQLTAQMDFGIIFQRPAFIPTEHQLNGPNARIKLQSHLLKLFDSGLTESARNGDRETDRQREVAVFVLCVINIGGEWVE